MMNINKILENHLHWLKRDCDNWESMKADLSGANLSRADLYRADLFKADLSGANLSRADLYRADLLRADLSGANLFGADLSGADISESTIDSDIMNTCFPSCCPEYGSFIGYKKAGGFIIKLEIQEDSKRSSAFGRKCRCSLAKVLAIENLDGTPADCNKIASDYDKDFIYEIGKIVTVENFDTDRRNECSPGIHFFITRQEAVIYGVV